MPLNIQGASEKVGSIAGFTIISETRNDRSQHLLAQSQNNV